MGGKTQRGWIGGTVKGTGRALWGIQSDRLHIGPKRRQDWGDQDESSCAHLIPYWSGSEKSQNYRIVVLLPTVEIVCISVSGIFTDEIIISFRLRYLLKFSVSVKNPKLYSRRWETTVFMVYADG